jgi:hypothetical protein
MRSRSPSSRPRVYGRGRVGTWLQDTRRARAPGRAADIAPFRSPSPLKRRCRAKEQRNIIRVSGVRVLLRHCAPSPLRRHRAKSPRSRSAGPDPNEPPRTPLGLTFVPPRVPRRLCRPGIRRVPSGARREYRRLQPHRSRRGNWQNTKTAASTSPTRPVPRATPPRTTSPRRWRKRVLACKTPPVQRLVHDGNPMCSSLAGAATAFSGRSGVAALSRSRRTEEFAGPVRFEDREAVRVAPARLSAAYERTVRGSPKCSNTAVSANQVIAATASPASVSTNRPEALAMPVCASGV